MTNRSAVEYFLSSEEFENSLVNQSFIQKISGEDDLDFDIDFDTTVDTDMDRNPYQKEQILLYINDAKKSVISSIENQTSKLSASIKEWAEKLGLDIYFDGIYTNDDNQVTIIFDIPMDKDSWNYNQYMDKDKDKDKQKSPTKRTLDEIEVIADEQWKDYKGKASYDDFLEIFKIGYTHNKNVSVPAIEKPIESPVETTVVAPVINPIAEDVNAELKKKYGVTTEDIGVTEDWWEKIKDKNFSVQKIVDMLTKDYSLTPINPEKQQTKKTNAESQKSHYICVVKDSRNNILGKYEVSFNDEDYAKMFLEAIGVRLRNGDKIEIE